MMKSKRSLYIHLSIALAIAAAQPVLAINKCISPDGKITFTDSACPLGDKTIKVDIVAPPPSDIKQAQEINDRTKRALDAYDEEQAKRAAKAAANAPAAPGNKAASGNPPPPPTNTDKKPAGGSSSNDDDRRRR